MGNEFEGEGMDWVCVEELERKVEIEEHPWRWTLFGTRATGLARRGESEEEKEEFEQEVAEEERLEKVANNLRRRLKGAWREVDDTVVQRVVFGRDVGPPV